MLRRRSCDAVAWVAMSFRGLVRALDRAGVRSPQIAKHRAIPPAEAVWVGGRTRRALAHALHSTQSHRLNGGTSRIVPFRIPGKKRWPAPLDDLSNSLLTTSFTSAR